jgi:hypothetical protein
VVVEEQPRNQRQAAEVPAYEDQDPLTKLRECVCERENPKMRRRSLLGSEK